MLTLTLTTPPTQAELLAEAKSAGEGRGSLGVDSLDKAPRCRACRLVGAALIRTDILPHSTSFDPSFVLGRARWARYSGTPPAYSHSNFVLDPPKYFVVVSQMAYVDIWVRVLAMCRRGVGLQVLESSWSY